MEKFEIANTNVVDMIDSYSDYLEEMQQEYPERFEDENYKYELVSELVYAWIEDERAMMYDFQYNLPILVIVDAGCWDGRRKAYTEIKSGNLSDILRSLESGGDSECAWYCDGEEIRCDETHHDGTNHYLYRKVTDEDAYETLLDKWFETGEWDKELLNKSTESIATDVAKALGWAA